MIASLADLYGAYLRQENILEAINVCVLTNESAGVLEQIIRWMID